MAQEVHCGEAPPQNLTVSPFDDEDADVIVQSSNGHKFRMYRVVLGKASPIFKDMFRLPQSPSISKKHDPPEVIDGLPVVYLSEDTRTLELLFSFCYPMEHPELSSLNDVHRVLEAANKYEMNAISACAREAWPIVAAQDPRRAFALACMMRWEGEACTAARLMLREPLWPLEPPLPPEFKYVAADTVVRLESYHRKCAAAARSCVENTAWSRRIFDNAMCPHCQTSATTTTQALRLRDWFNKYTRRATEILTIQPAVRMVQDKDLVMRIVHEVFGSPPCEATTHCMERINSIVTLFGEELEGAIGKVVLDLDL